MSSAAVSLHRAIHRQGNPLRRLIPADHGESVMAKKQKRVTKAKTDNELAANIKQSATQIWLAGLGAFAKAQVEGTRIFDGLVKKGQKAQDRAKKTALKAQADSAKFFADLVKEGEKTQSRATRAANSSIADVRAKATGTWGKLENVFEDRVAKALHTLNVPTKKDIDMLGKRVAELTAVTKKLAASAHVSGPSSSAH
jgi:poly(hydroxyalkanoate) granule-associated protein